MAGLARPSASVHPRAALKTRVAGPSPASGMARRSCEGGLGDVSNTAIPHAGLRVLPAVFPSRRPFRCRRFRHRLHPAAAQPETRNYLWQYQLPPCASCSKPAFTSAIIPAGGTPRWRRTFSASATASTSSTSSRPNRCCTRALQAVRDVVAGGGRVLLVGTKRQAQEPVADAAKRCGQYYVNYRWLGGMLTNFKTISPVDQAAARTRGTALPRADRIDQARTAWS